MDRMSKELAEFSAQDEARRIQNLKLNELQFFVRRMLILSAGYDDKTV